MSKSGGKNEIRDGRGRMGLAGVNILLRRYGGFPIREQFFANAEQIAGTQRNGVLRECQGVTAPEDFFAGEFEASLGGF